MYSIPYSQRVAQVAVRKLMVQLLHIKYGGTKQPSVHRSPIVRIGLYPILSLHIRP